jgi:hypothetical protein
LQVEAKQMKKNWQLKKTIFWLGLFMGLAVPADSLENRPGADCTINLPILLTSQPPDEIENPAVLIEVGSEAGSTGDRSEGAEYGETFSLYLQAAEQDYTTAQLLFGFLYNEAYDVSFFDREATRRCRQAAELGDAAAQIKLGSMYVDGNGVEQDYKEAAKWFRRAADHGHPDGQLLLGEMYYQGRGVPQDYVQAYKWWSLAAAKSSGSNREQAVFNRYLAEEKMSLAQIREAQRLTRKLTRSQPSS